MQDIQTLKDWVGTLRERQKRNGLLSGLHYLHVTLVDAPQPAKVLVQT
jgi:hypothetical protein